MSNKSLKNFVNQFVNLLQDEVEGEEEENGASPPRVKRHAADGSAHQDEASEQVRKMARMQDVIQAGGVQMIGLEKIQAHFGDEWDNMSEKVHQIAEGLIGKHLSSTDICSQYDELNYVIVFSQLSRTDAEVKCGLIAKKISDYLLGIGVPEGAFQAKTVTTTVSGELVAEEFNVMEKIASALGSDQGGAGPKKKKAQAKSKGASEEASSQLPLDLDIAYRPVWDVNRGALLAFRCLPILGSEIRPGMVAGDAVLGSAPRKEIVFLLDLFVLGGLIQTLVENMRQNKRSLMICPVHYDTISDGKSMARYKRACAEIPESLRSFIIFEIKNMPNDVPQVRLAGLFPYLKPFCREIWIESSQLKLPLSGLKQIGVSCVGVDLDSLPVQESELFPFVEKFALALKKHGLSPYAHGVHTISLATATVCSGFSALNGDAVHNMTAQTDQVVRFNCEDLFGDFKDVALL